MGSISLPGVFTAKIDGYHCELGKSCPWTPHGYLTLKFTATERGKYFEVLLTGTVKDYEKPFLGTLLSKDPKTGKFKQFANFVGTKRRAHE